MKLEWERVCVGVAEAVSGGESVLGAEAVSGAITDAEQCLFPFRHCLYLSLLSLAPLGVS